MIIVCVTKASFFDFFYSTAMSTRLHFGVRVNKYCSQAGGANTSSRSSLRRSGYCHMPEWGWEPRERTKQAFVARPKIGDTKKVGERAVY